MREIQLKDAKAMLSVVVDDALRGEEFVIARHGRKEVVVISWTTWQRAPVKYSELRPYSDRLSAGGRRYSGTDRTALRDTDL